VPHSSLSPDASAPQLPLDSRDALYVARQPILDARGEVFGYELLYRGAAAETACTAPGDVASARVLADTVLSLGLNSITDGRPAFLNLTRSLLLSPVIRLLSPAAAVFELHEDIPVDSEVVETCRQLHAAGYTLALDDFVPHSDAEALMPFVRFVKVDVLAIPAAQQQELAQRLRPTGIRLVAEKVETEAMFHATREAGYGLFQGFFFCRPAMRAAAAVPARQLAYLELLSALNAPRLTISDVEHLVRRDVSLCYRVLRCVNSAAFGLRKEVQSIGQALVLLGIGPIRSWASVWCLAGLNTGASAELVTMALVRARACELLGEQLGDGEGAGPELFLIGLCSLLDAMLRRPMPEALRELPLTTQAEQALLGTPNRARCVLDAVIAYERGEWDAATNAATSVGLNGPALASAFDEALRWTRSFGSAGSAVREGAAN
jgi:EAL and modified HD-GYP domain-containing signal transduction protein